jgi:hypothetical protein
MPVMMMIMNYIYLARIPWILIYWCNRCYVSSETSHFKAEHMGQKTALCKCFHEPYFCCQKKDDCMQIIVKTELVLLVTGACCDLTDKFVSISSRSIIINYII